MLQPSVVNGFNNGAPWQPARPASKAAASASFGISTLFIRVK
jgi:hypothetical protein